MDNKNTTNSTADHESPETDENKAGGLSKPDTTELMSPRIDPFNPYILTAIRRLPEDRTVKEDNADSFKPDIIDLISPRMS